MSNFFRNIHPLLRRNKRPEKYDDTNFAVLNALNYELTQAEQETIASKIQSSLESATDTYLDTWGDWFGVYRKDGWDDEYYRARIIRELLLKRGTIPAIIDALVDFLNDNDAVVQIYEPWRNIFYTNKSKLNGDDHLMGYYYRFAIIDISIDRPFPPEIVEIIKAFKPAGVLFYLRLDTSLDKNKTTVESPYVYLDVTNKTELEFLNGLYYDLRGNINLSDQRTQVVGNNIFHTNNSKLNGEDVLAGAFNHGRGYVHLASTTLLDYTPKATDSMSNLKTTLGEAGSDMYNQTKEKDGRTASIQVPATKNVHTLYSNSLDFGDYDYSTAPNLLPTLDYSKLSKNGSALQTPLPYIKDYGDYFVLDANDASAVGTSRNCFVPLVTRLTKGKTYTISVSMMFDDEFADNQGYSSSPLYYTIVTNNPYTADKLVVIYPTADMRNNWKRVSKVFTVPADQKDGDYIYLQLYQADRVKGKLYIRYDMMIQEGDQTSSQAPANQIPKLGFDDYNFSDPTNITKTEEEGNITSFNALPTSKGERHIYVRNDVKKYLPIPLLQHSKQYTMSAEVWLEKEFDRDIWFRYRVNDRKGNATLPLVATTKGVPAKQWTEISVTGIINLPSNPNMVKPESQKPVTTSEYNIGTYNTTPMVKGKKYTITLKGTKPDTQSFRPFFNSEGIPDWGISDMKLVAGTTDIYSGTFTCSADSHPTSPQVQIYQVPSTTVGECTIEWLKIEEGETYTPDYPQHWLHIAIPREYEGIIKIKNDSIKIQEGTKTTKPAWKPNLLAEPYEVGDVPVQPNIAPNVGLPVTTSTQLITQQTLKDYVVKGETYTVTLKGTKPANQGFRVFIAQDNGNRTMADMKPIEGLPDQWGATFTYNIDNTNTGAKQLRIYQRYSELGSCKIDWVKIEKGNTRTPNIDSYNYVGSLIEDTETPTLDPTKYTWTVNGDVTNKKAYMVFDIKTFIEENYATEFEKLVADLGEDQALNAVFENFNISTALKALVSPSSPINFSVELYDFSTSTWHKLNTDSLDLRMRTFNLVANRITDYLNDYKLLFVRYVFDNKTDKDVTVELDMLNVLFNYRLGDGYSLGLQSTVECLSEIPLKGLTLSSESVEVAIDETSKVIATPVPANATNKSLEWEIADPKIATVDTSGNITGVAIGETTLTVYGEDRTISATCSVSVKARHTLYSNSVDFGNYDYSGNPNLLSNVTNDSWTAEGVMKVTAVDDYLELVKDTTGRYGTAKIYNIPALRSDSQYTTSLEFYLKSGTSAEDLKKCNIAIEATNTSGQVFYSVIYMNNIPKMDEWVDLTSTFTTNTYTDSLTDWKFRVYVHPDVSASMRIRNNIKIEKGSTATPYQPNLLNAPYYLSKVPLGENLCDPTVKFPITSSVETLYSGRAPEDFVEGETYTVTIGATKPPAQSFGVYLALENHAIFKSVEGLPNTWTATLKIDRLGEKKNAVYIYQSPRQSVGACQIDWLKIEKGDTRTPNIDSYAYRGTVLTTSEESPKDPNAYTWSSI